MRNIFHLIFSGFLVLCGLDLAPAFAEGLPTYDDFRRVDRTRRVLGQVQTKELMDISQIDSNLIFEVIQKRTNDVNILWGGAELISTWADKRALYETALQASRTNVQIALRFSCAAARQGESELALKWAKYCEENDNDNVVPWLTEIFVLARKKAKLDDLHPPPVGTLVYHDYTAEATTARVRLLEAIGYSRYSARRLGFKPESDALIITRDLIKPPVAEVTRALLKETATYLQHRRQFLLTEMVGQTIERALYSMRPDAGDSGEVQRRNEEIDKRRDDLKILLGEVDRNVVDQASEKQMVTYFDEVLSLGEEEAMKSLSISVRRATTFPVPEFTPGR